MKIELLASEDCPHRDAMLALLEDVLEELGLEVPIQHILVPDHEAALNLRFVGSPSVRINDQDIDPEGAERGQFGLQCRLYSTTRGMENLPERADFLWAVVAAQQTDGR